MSLPVCLLLVAAAVVRVPVDARSIHAGSAFALPVAIAKPGLAAIDTAHSVVRWRGTKFGGRGAHAGTLRVRQGELRYDGGKAEIDGGYIELDMRSLAVTDMPLAETDARRKLAAHLLAADFFDVARFPSARFEIDRVRHHGGNLVRLDGRLTMRGGTRPFGFEATIWSFEPTRLHATARATLDRQQWGVAFRGSRLTNDLVDDTIHLEFDIVARVVAGGVR